MSLGSNRVDSMRSLWKITIWIRPIEVRYYMHSREQFNTGVCAVTKWSETHRNISLVNKGVDWTRSLWKIPIWIRPYKVVHYMHCRKQFLTSLGSNKIIQNTHKHEFRVQWTGLDAFMVDNSDFDSTTRSRELHALSATVSQWCLCCNKIVPNTIKHEFRL